MAVLAIIKRKGGVGSSTIAANLAGVFVARGRRVLLLDADAQHSASSWAAFSTLDGTHGCLTDVVLEVDTESPGEFREILENAVQEAELVIVDAAPGFPVTALQAARAADVVLIPCGPSPLDFGPASDAMEIAQECRDGRDKPVVMFVPSKNLPRTRLGRELPGALEELGLNFNTGVLPGISQRIAVAESALTGLTINEYEPGGDSAKEFMALADAIEELIR